MRIDNQNVNLTQSLGEIAPATQSAHGSRTDHSTGGSDQVQLSDFASQISTDPSRLEQLQAAYANGTYNASPNQIAASMIHFSLQA